VDGDINRTISFRPKASDRVVEGKRGKTEKTARPMAPDRAGVAQIFNIRVLNDMGEIIKMERGRDGIEIYNGAKKKNDQDISEIALMH